MIYKFRNLETGQAQAIPPGEFSIGRDEAMQVQVDDLSVSRFHAILFNQEGRLSMEDNGSANGTLKGKEFISGRVPLKLGDIVYIGSVPFRVDPELRDDQGKPMDSPGDAMVANRASFHLDTQRLSPEARGMPEEPELPVVIRRSTAAVPRTPQEGAEKVIIGYPRPSQEIRAAQELYPIAEVSSLTPFPWGFIALAFLTGLVLGIVFGVLLAKPILEMSAHS